MAGYDGARRGTSPDNNGCSLRSGNTLAFLGSMNPSFSNSVSWQRAWRTHGDISLSPVAARGLTDADLEAMEPQIVDLDFSQLDADPSRAQDGRGTSACVLIQAKLFLFFLASWLRLPETFAEMRAFVAETVREFDFFIIRIREQKPWCNGGIVPYEGIRHVFSNPELLTVRILEGNLDDFSEEINTAECLHKVCLKHAHIQLQSSQRVAMMITSPKYGSVDVSNSYGILIDQQMEFLQFTDSHGREEVDGTALGMVTGRVGLRVGLERALWQIVNWLCTLHLPRVGCQAYL